MGIAFWRLEVGFDMIPRDRNLRDKIGFDANIYLMKYLRAAMIAAGVSKRLVYKKFTSNSGYVVTDLQSKEIAEKLTAWLKGRSLMLDLGEDDESVKRSNKVYLSVILAVASESQKKAAKRFLAGSVPPVKVDAELRKSIREFANFCSRSGSFWVD